MFTSLSLICKMQGPICQIDLMCYLRLSDFGFSPTKVVLISRCVPGDHGVAAAWWPVGHRHGAPVASPVFPAVAFSTQLRQPTPLPQLHPPNPPTQSNKPFHFWPFFLLVLCCLIFSLLPCWVTHTSDLQNLKEKEKCEWQGGWAGFKWQQVDFPSPSNIENQEIRF